MLFSHLHSLRIFCLNILFRILFYSLNSVSILSHYPNSNPILLAIFCINYKRMKLRPSQHLTKPCRNNLLPNNQRLSTYQKISSCRQVTSTTNNSVQESYAVTHHQSSSEVPFNISQLTRFKQTFNITPS